MSVIVNIGMWFERFVIIVTSVYRDYLPSAGVHITARAFTRSVFIWYVRIVLYLLLPVCEILPGYCSGGDQIDFENQR